MNTYDEAHALAKAIRECDEMKRLTQAAEKIKSNADAGKMVKEYIMAQMKSDYAKLAGQETDEQEYRHLQELALLISNNSDAQEYLQAFDGTRWLRIFRRSFLMRWRRVWMYWICKNDKLEQLF